MHIYFSNLKGFLIFEFGGVSDGCGHINGNGSNWRAMGDGEINNSGDGIDSGELDGDGSGDTTLSEEYGNGYGDGFMWEPFQFDLGFDIDF